MVFVFEMWKQNCPSIEKINIQIGNFIFEKRNYDGYSAF